MTNQRPTIPLSLRWSVETSRPCPYAAQAYRGESVVLSASLDEYGAAVDLTGASAALYWHPVGAEDPTAWWEAPAAAAGNVVSATFDAASMDDGHDAYVFFLQAAGAGGKCYRANGVIRMLASPGAVPNEIPFPPRVIDFATVTVSNAPYYTRAELDALLAAKAPSIHASSHAASGADPITPASIGALPSSARSVGTGNIAANAVTTAKLAASAVTNDKIQNGTIQKAKLATAVQTQLNQIDQKVSRDGDDMYGPLNFYVEGESWISGSGESFTGTVHFDFDAFDPNGDYSDYLTGHITGEFYWYEEDPDNPGEYLEMSAIVDEDIYLQGSGGSYGSEIYLDGRLFYLRFEGYYDSDYGEISLQIFLEDEFYTVSAEAYLCWSDYARGNYWDIWKAKQGPAATEGELVSLREEVSSDVQSSVQSAVSSHNSSSTAHSSLGFAKYEPAQTLSYANGTTNLTAPSWGKSYFFNGHSASANTYVFNLPRLYGSTTNDRYMQVAQVTIFGLVGRSVKIKLKYPWGKTSPARTADYTVFDGASFSSWFTSHPQPIASNPAAFARINVVVFVSPDMSPPSHFPPRVTVELSTYEKGDNATSVTDSSFSGMSKSWDSLQ